TYFLYARKSTDVEDKQVLSIEAQIAELRKYAKDNGLVVVDIIIEKKSAKVPGRPKFGKMLERIQNGEASGILAWHPDRLARNSIDGGQIIYLLDQRKLADLKFQTFWFENTSQGKFMLNIAFGQSKYYVDNLSENTKRGQRQKVRRGEFPGHAPFGYYNNVKNKSIHIDARQAEFVRKMFEIYAKGDSRFQDISDYLFGCGVKTKGGKPFHKDRIKQTLTNPIYYGHFIYCGEVHEGKHQPIISKKLFDRVQSVVVRRSHPTKGLIEPQPFCGLLRCSCGMSVTAEHKIKRQKCGNVHNYVYYRCSRKSRQVRCVETAVRSEVADEQLSDLLGGFALPVAWADKMREMAERDENAEQSQNDGAIESLRVRVSHLSEKLGRLLDSFLDGVIEREIYVAKKAEIMSEKKTFEEQISDLSLGVCGWVEPLKNWLKTAVSLCEIAKSDDQIAKKNRLLEIFGLNLFLVDKKIVAAGDPNPNSPLSVRPFGADYDLWILLRKIRLTMSQSDTELNAKIAPNGRSERTLSENCWNVEVSAGFEPAM
ncbi:MAG: recombinase family protein, partial [Candidatus Nomurabacteria bacterium]|nr:recombinase family protein [Candidatus Nomurabacteria bacterium]